MTGKPVVELPTVFRACVLASERTLLRHCVSSPFGERAQLMRGLTEARILIARLLVVFRWMSTRPILEPVDTLSNALDQRLRTFHGELANINASFHQEKPKEDEQHSILPRPHTSVCARNVFSELFLHGIPKRMRYIGTWGRMIRFSAPGEYEVTFRADRSGILRVRRFVLFSVKERDMPSPILVRLAALLRSLESNQGVLLHTLDRILHSVHVACLFAEIAREMYAKASAFHATLSRKEDDPRSLYLEFKDPMWHGGRFVMTVRRGMIILAAKNAMFGPAVGEAVVGPAGLVEQIYQKRMPVVRLDGTNHSVEEILGHFRDLVYASSLHMVFVTVTYSLRSLFSNFPTVKRTFSMEKATLGNVSVSLDSQEVMTLCVQHWTGHVQIEFHNVFLPKTSSKEPVCVENVGELYETINTSISNVLVNLVGVVLYGSTVNQYSAFNNPGSYFRCFSFAPDFYLFVAGKRGFPRVSIVDASLKSYSIPEMVQMESLRSLRAWKMLIPVMFCAKRFLFLAQLQRYLTELNIDSILLAQYLEVDVAPSGKCTVKMTERGWKIVFRPTPSVLTPRIKSISKWHGRTYTARIAYMLAQLIHLYQIWSLTREYLALACQNSFVITSMLMTDENEVFLRVASKNNDTLIFSFGENAVFGGTIGRVRYHECGWSFRPQIRARCARNIPLSNFLTGMLYKTVGCEELFSFLSHELLMCLEFHRVFNRPNWYFTEFAGPDKITLLMYKNKYTDMVAFRPYQTVAACASSHGPSVLLNACHSLFHKRYGTPSPLMLNRLAIDISQLEPFRDMIARVCDVADVILSHGFTSLSSGNEEPQLSFKLNNVQVTIDDVDITISVEDNVRALQGVSALCRGEYQNTSLINAVLTFTQRLSDDTTSLTVLSELLLELKTENVFSQEVLVDAMNSVTMSDLEGQWCIPFTRKNIQIQARPYCGFPLILREAGGRKTFKDVATLCGHIKENH